MRPADGSAVFFFLSLFFDLVPLQTVLAIQDRPSFKVHVPHVPRIREAAALSSLR